MTLRADKRDYKQGFKKHYHAYKYWGDAGSIISKQMILVYCVECGLKYLLMEQERISVVAEARQDIQKKLKCHDFQMLLKSIHRTEYCFPTIRTKHDEPIQPDNYHQACRYAICQDDDNHAKYCAVLQEVSEWINERVI